MRPSEVVVAIEQYVRVSEQYYGSHWPMECNVGLEYKTGEDLKLLADEVGEVARESLVYGGDNHHLVSGFVIGWILSNYPDRAYFVETEKEGRGVQVYDPMDFVKERCPCGQTCRRT